MITAEIARCFRLSRLGGGSRWLPAQKRGRLWLTAACLAVVSTIGIALMAQPPVLSITLTGQSMIRSDIRAHAPAAVPIIASLLKGDVVFTNF